MDRALDSVNILELLGSTLCLEYLGFFSIEPNSIKLWFGNNHEHIEESFLFPFGIKRNQTETELNNADADAMCYKTIFG